MEEQNVCEWLISSLGAWKSGKTECLKLNLKGKEEVEKQRKVDEKVITFLSGVCLLFPYFVLHEVPVLTICHAILKNSCVICTG